MPYRARIMKSHAKDEANKNEAKKNNVKNVNLRTANRFNAD